MLLNLNETKNDDNDIVQFIFLNTVWGYRQGPGGAHTKFELKSHNSNCCWVQAFTDLLFRNIQQYSVGGIVN